MLGSNASQDIAQLHIKMRESLLVHKLLLVPRYCPLSVLVLAAIITIILHIISLTSQSTFYISVIIATLLSITTVKVTLENWNCISLSRPRTSQYGVSAQQEAARCS